MKPFVVEVGGRVEQALSELAAAMVVVRKARRDGGEEAVGMVT